MESKLAKFDADELQKTKNGWRVSLEWEALQPQRKRVIKPILYVSTPSAAKLSLSAKVFADSFPEPLSLQAELGVEVKEKNISLMEIMPDWNKLFDK